MTAYIDLAATLIKRLEGCRLTGYADTGGVPTNGYGHTGPEVRVGQTVTQEIADHNLTVDLATAEGKILRYVKATAWAPLHDHEKAALISFAFNVGAGPTWEIWKDINNGNLSDVPTQLRRFDKGEVDGKRVTISGLDNRREAEITFWNTADVNAAAAAATVAGIVRTGPSSGYVRELPTPPTPVPPPPLAKASLTTKLVTATAAAGATASQIHGIIAPHADESHIFQTLAVLASGVVVAAAIIGLLIHGEQAHQRAQ